jgi:hypothetical protein
LIPAILMGRNLGTPIAKVIFGVAGWAGSTSCILW